MTKNSNELVSNRKARHNYEIIETLEAGIVLMGTEIKSLRHHGGSLDESYVTISSGAAHLKNAFIAQYTFGNIHNHEEKRERKLLLHKRELLKLKQAIDQKGMALIPLSIHLKRGKAKVLIALAKGKKTYDKRESMKKEQIAKDIRKAIREHS
ncbi:MAG: SsrA-binding protein SmpB [Simkaniaceae bacterium]|nr:SsrA-binding protein SmpB [Simkaniaceae bacterium]MCF7852901.1 SsrA-binding protein SmpB [Simkaniaceae bacterium]